MTPPHGAELNEIVEGINALIARGVEALGLDPAIPGLHAIALANGQIQLERERGTGVNNTTNIRIDHLSNKDSVLPGHDLERIDRAIHRHVRRQMRLKALTAAGIESNTRKAPPWSYTAHALTLAWLRQAKLDPAVMVALNNHGSFAAKGMTELIAEAHGVDLGDISIEDGRVDVRHVAVKAETGIVFIGQGRPALHLSATLPETVMVAATGRRLSEVVGHPAVARAGPIRIVEAIPIKAIPGNAGTILILEDVQQFIRRPPTGTDRRWQRIDFKA